MSINDVNYKLDHGDIAIPHIIRRSLFTALYSNQDCIKDLTNIIAKYIDCLSIDFNAPTYTFTIKIKKTTMRKVSGFCHEPNFYYNIISNIFMEFMQMHEQLLIPVLQQYNLDAVYTLGYVYNKSSILANLCHTLCMGDNILVIKL